MILTSTCSGGIASGENFRLVKVLATDEETILRIMTSPTLAGCASRARKIEGDPAREWWQEFDERPDGYWRRLEAVLDFMAARGMVANLCILDHVTFTSS